MEAKEETDSWGHHSLETYAESQPIYPRCAEFTIVGNELRGAVETRKANDQYVLVDSSFINGQWYNPSK